MGIPQRWMTLCDRLARFKRNYRAWEENHPNITLCTVDVRQEELVPVNEIVRRITEISLQ
jgi:hypothetical protein